jgi:hypothetical protein
LPLPVSENRKVQSKASRSTAYANPAPHTILITIYYKSKKRKLKFGRDTNIKIAWYDMSLLLVHEEPVSGPYASRSLNILGINVIKTHQGADDFRFFFSRQRKKVKKTEKLYIQQRSLTITTLMG